jgi:hypothetical protein
MFIKLAQALVQSGKGDQYDVFSFHPLQLQVALDAFWDYARTRTPAVAPIMPDAGIGDRTPQQGAMSLRDEMLRVLQDAYPSKDLSGDVLADALARMADTLQRPRAPRLWHHLIYAYLIENTRIFEVCARVLEEALHGERLGSISEDGHRWLRATEELFFRDSGFSFISSMQSSIRPDIRATRRNAYYRMFSIDLNHGTRDNQPYPYVKPEAANRDFVSTLENLLREAWRGYINARNTSGSNTTDDSVLADLALKLQEMLGERRIGGNLSREEYVAVCTATWFHLTVAAPDSPIVVDLKANATTPEERLRKLGERVGVVPHSRSRSMFLLAEPLSRFLVEVERGTYSTATNAPMLYDPGQPGNVTADTLEIVNQWSAATGKDLKAVPVSTAR